MKRFLLLVAQTFRFENLKAKALSYMLTGAVTLIAAFSLCLFSQPNAHATGGGYTSTKHGGKSIDPPSAPVAPCAGGANRGIGTDYIGAGNCSAPGVYYNATEGTYAAGECAHCHEPHASFGGTEPAPNTAGTDAGPDPYLLMKDYNSATAGTYTNLCLYCHNNISMNSQTTGYGYWGFYQGGTNYQASSHYTSTNFKYPGIQTGDTAAGTEPWPRRSRTALSSGNTGSCLNCHTPHGISGAANYPNDAVAPNTTNPSYGVSSSAAGLIPRQLIAWEEALCLRCHDTDGTTGAGTAPNIKSDIDQRVTDAIPANSLASGHAVRKYFGLHNLANETGATKRVAGWNSGANWHVECTDCHNPHLVAKGPAASVPGSTLAYSFQRSGKAQSYNNNRGGTSTTAGLVQIANANKGVWGVSWTNAAGIYTIGAYAAKEPVTYVYELCLKCHSTFGDATTQKAPSTDSTRLGTATTGGVPTNANFTDVGVEFDPDNCGAAPPVNGAIHPVFAIGCNQPTAGLNANWTSIGARVAPWNTNTLSNTFVPPWQHTSYITCIDCHRGDNIAGPYGPHGSSRQFILAVFDTGITYDYCTNAGCTTTATLDYNTYAPKGTADTGGTLASTDTPNFCVNCHRVDVYGFQGQGVYPLRNTQSRLSHPPDGAPPSTSGGGQSFTTASPPRGIVCLRCHGGRILGGIHGINTTVARGQNAEGAPWGTNAGKAFVYGATWRGYTKATTAVSGTCFRTKTVVTGFDTNTCTQHGDSSAAGGTIGTANYDY
ncbi:MAG: hypothetical protein HZC16_02580 [Candidatus Omnitrophica bacterium]|nr:hypothetical protein [Candidatus Omnitrophota bacterium]